MDGKDDQHRTKPRILYKKIGYKIIIYINSVSLSVMDVLGGGGRERPVKQRVKGGASMGGQHGKGGGAWARKDRARGSSTGSVSPFVCDEGFGGWGRERPGSEYKCRGIKAKGFFRCFRNSDRLAD
jgi:hypothetical protein